MDERDVPGDLDWAGLEGEWRVDTAYDKLKETVERDAQSSEKASVGNHYGTYFFCEALGVQEQFRVHLVDLAAGGDRQWCARVTKARRSQTIDVEVFKLDAIGRPQPEFCKTFRFEPRISDYGEQKFAEIDSDRKVLGSLLYPWQVSRKLVDRLRVALHANERRP